MKSLTIILSVITASLASAQTILCPPDAPANVKLAAKEIRKGLAWRSARGLRAGQSDEQGFQGSWEPERSGDRLSGGQPREG